MLDNEPDFNRSTCVCTHIRVCTELPVYLYTYMYIYIYVYTYMYISVYICIYA